MSLVEKALKKLQESRDSSVSTLQTTRRPPSLAVDASLLPAQNVRVPHVEARQPVEPQIPKMRVSVNKDALRAAGLLPPEHQERQLADQYRQIKRPLLTTAFNKGQDAARNARLIMVSSAMPGDGKTFTSINLSLSLSREKDISVLLIDADVAKPHISRLFGVDKEPGLLDALLEPSLQIESLILPTEVPGLSILPAGRWSENATELLSSQRMEALVAALETYDATRLVVVDSPPLLLTNESRVLAQWVGQIVVVVRAGKTQQKDLLDALSHLDQGKAIGLVLNQSASTSPGYYYGYGDRDSTSS